MNDNSLPNVSIVVIGRNEALNLDDTFNAINSIDYPKSRLEIIFVDTNSSDNSVEKAKKYADKVFEEVSIWPSSGLARNKGILEAKYDIIHFIDGDISIHPLFLKIAIKKLFESDAQAITGYFIEKNISNFFNRIMNIRRDMIMHKEHYCESTNGGGTYKKEALLNIQGYDERILKGQESELGYRFRNAGYKILFIDEIQGIHNFGLDSILDFFKSKYIYGRSLGYIIKIKDDLNIVIKNFQKVGYKTIINNLVSLIIIFSSIFTRSYWVLLCYYFSRLAYIVIIKKIKKKSTTRELIYNLIQYLFSFAIFFGILEILMNKKYTSNKKQLLN